MAQIGITSKETELYPVLEFSLLGSNSYLGHSLPKPSFLELLSRTGRSSAVYFGNSWHCSSLDSSPTFPFFNCLHCFRDTRRLVTALAPEEDTPSSAAWPDEPPKAAATAADRATTATAVTTSSQQPTSTAVPEGIEGESSPVPFGYGVVLVVLEVPVLVLVFFWGHIKNVPHRHYQLQLRLYKHKRNTDKPSITKPRFTRHAGTDLSLKFDEWIFDRSLSCVNMGFLSITISLYIHAQKRCWMFYTQTKTCGSFSLWT